MITNKILIPLIEKKDHILDDDIAMIKEEYFIIKDKRNPDLIYLFPKDFFLEDSYFYNIFDLSRYIKEKYGDNVIYIILDENEEENIGYTIGNTKYMNKKYHAKGIILKDKWKTESDVLLKMLSFVPNLIDLRKIIIFKLEDNKIINGISKKILQNFEKEHYVEEYKKKNFLKILENVKAYEKKEQIIIPYIVGIVISILIFGGSMFLVKYKNNLIQQKIENQIRAYKEKILNIENEYFNLNKTYSKETKILKRLELKKVYKGTAND